MAPPLSYMAKLKGMGGRAPPRVPFKRSVATFFISFVGMLVLSLIHFEGMPNGEIDAAVATVAAAPVNDTARYEKGDFIMLIGSQAATAVLVFNAIKSPLAQPRNVIFGNMISAFWGVAFAKSIPASHTWIAVPLAVSMAMFFMDITRTLHPPGGATALIAVIGSAKVKALGWMYILVPVASSSIILVAIAVLLNNVLDDRHYPTFYFGLDTGGSGGASGGGGGNNTALETARAGVVSGGTSYATHTAVDVAAISMPGLAENKIAIASTAV